MNSRKEDLLTKSQNLSPDQGLAKEDNNQRIQKKKLAKTAYLCGVDQTGEPPLLDRYSFCLKRQIVISDDGYLIAC